MRPVGLTLKSNDELAIIHQCTKCGIISCNRIAGDDSPHSILSLLENPIQLRRTQTLTMEDKEQVLTALFGYNHPEI
jgi:hypothetical protein